MANSILFFHVDSEHRSNLVARIRCFRWNCSRIQQGQDWISRSFCQGQGKACLKDKRCTSMKLEIRVVY